MLNPNLRIELYPAACSDEEPAVVKETEQKVEVKEPTKEVKETTDKEDTETNNGEYLKYKNTSESVQAAVAKTLSNIYLALATN